MKKLRFAMLALAAVAVSACAGPQAATRNAVSTAPLEPSALTQTEPSVAKQHQALLRGLATTYIFQT